MNARQVASVIESACRDLFGSHLIRFYNLPCERQVDLIQRVSHPTSGRPATQFPFGSLDEYLSIIKDGSFTCILFDYSVIQASYDCSGNLIVAHNLLYWPSPIVPKTSLESLADIEEAIQLWLESPSRAVPLCELVLRSPMRFDFDPERASEGHPLVHLHTQFEDTRIHVERPMSFTTFVKMVFQTFYADKWTQHPLLGRFHEQPIPFVGDEFEPNSHTMCLSWPTGSGRAAINVASEDDD
jgi:hypothetical protein